VYDLPHTLHSRIRRKQEIQISLSPIKKGLTLIITVVEVLQDSHVSSEAFVFQAPMKMNRSKGRNRKPGSNNTLLPLSWGTSSSERKDPTLKPLSGTPLIYLLPLSFPFESFKGGDPMTMEGVKRKLTAIFSADVKGYSRLMRKDEETTIRTLTAYHHTRGHRSR
jgi:hypothetical protein